MCNYFYIELYDYYSNFVAKIIIVLFGLLYRLEISLVIDPEILRQGEEPALVGGVGAGAGYIPLAPFHLHPPPLRQGGGGMHPSGNVLERQFAFLCQSYCNPRGANSHVHFF